MAMYGQGKTRGKTSILAIESAMNQACAAIEPGAEADPHYLLAYLRHSYEMIRALSNAGGQENLSGEIVKKIQVVLPGLDEQKQIAMTSQHSAQLIESLERLITKKQAIKQGMMQQLLTGATYPHQISASLGEISTFITKGATPTTYGFSWESSGVPFLRSECVADEGLDLRQSMYISEAANQMLRRSQVKDGDLLMTITGNVGRVIRLSGLGTANINQHIARIRIRDNRFHSGYVFHYLSQHSVREYYESIVTGQAYPQISLKQVRDTEVPAPKLEQQRMIAEALDAIDTETATLKMRREKARNIRTGMMQQLLTGRTRLPVEVAS